MVASYWPTAKPSGSLLNCSRYWRRNWSISGVPPDTGDALVSAHTSLSSPGSSRAAVGGWCIADPATTGMPSFAVATCLMNSAVGPECRCRRMASALAAATLPTTGDMSLTEVSSASSMTGVNPAFFSCSRIWPRPLWPYAVVW